MSFDTVLLLANAGEGLQLSKRLLQERSDLDIDILPRLSDLVALPPSRMARARLLSFLFEDIVPGKTLSQLGFGAYNFHPGPPEYPGWAPVSFALYDGVRAFGATLHHMAAKVDSGGIVEVETFPIADGMEQAELSEAVYGACLRLFWRHARPLATQPAPLPISPLAWGGRRTTRADFARLCRLSPALNREEIDRRRKAFGLGDGFSTPPSQT